MEYDFHKSKIPKGLSYPIKRGVLDKTLESSGTARIKWMDYSVAASRGIIVRAGFVGEAHKSLSIGRIGVSIYALRRGRKKTDRGFVD